MYFEFFSTTKPIYGNKKNIIKLAIADDEDNNNEPRSVSDSVHGTKTLAIPIETEQIKFDISNTNIFIYKLPQYQH